VLVARAGDKLLRTGPRAGTEVKHINRGGGAGEVVITWKVIAMQKLLCISVVISELLPSGKGGGLSEMPGGSLGPVAA